MTTVSYLLPNHNECTRPSTDSFTKKEVSDFLGAIKTGVHKTLFETPKRNDSSIYSLNYDQLLALMEESSWPDAALHNRLPSDRQEQLSEACKPADNFHNKLARELQKFEVIAKSIRCKLIPEDSFELRCQQAFYVANDLFGNAPTWVCFYRELMGGEGLIPQLFPSNEDFGNFLRCDQYYQVQMMLTALRSRELPENDPNDPQRMITVRLPQSLHEALCDEAVRLGMSVNRLCISRLLQLLDPKMIPDTGTPRGRRARSKAEVSPDQSKRPRGASCQERRDLVHGAELLSD